MKQGHAEEALVYLEAALQGLSKPLPRLRALLLHHLAQAQLATGNPEAAERARELLLEASRLEGASLEVWNAIGAGFLAAGEAEAALKVLAQVVASFPDHANARSNLALCLHSMRRWGEAAQAYQQLLLELDATHRPALNNYAVLFAQQRQLTHARELLAERCGGGGGNGSGGEHTANNLACVLTALGQLEAAQEVLESAVYAGSQLPAPVQRAAHYNLSKLLMYLGEFERATFFLEGLLRSEQGRSSASLAAAQARYHASLGIVARERLEARALDQDEQLQGATPEERETRLRSAEEREREAAYEHFSRALEADERSAVARLQLGILNLEQGEYEQAQEQFKNALKYRPELAAAWNNLSIALQLQGDTREAEGAYESALSLCANSYQTLNNLAVLCRQQGQLDRALKLLDRCLALRPEYPLALNNKALVLIRLGPQHYPDALQLFERAYELDPRLRCAYANRLKLLSLMHSRGQQPL